MNRLVRSIKRSAAASPLVAGPAHSPSHAAAVDQTSDVLPKKSVPGRAAELVTAEETADCESAIKRARWSLRVDIVAVAIGVGLWALSHFDSLGLAKVLAGPEDQVSYRIGFLSIAALGVGGAILSYLDQRALRLGTERARKQANAARAVARGLMIPAGVGAFLFFLVLLGLVLRDVISDWLTTRYLRNHIVLVHGILSMLILPFILPVCFWIEAWAKSSGLIAAVIGFSVLLTAHVALTLGKLQQPELSWWLVPLFDAMIAAFLIWGIAILARAIHRRQS
jgi:hypothetical protein